MVSPDSSLRLPFSVSRPGTADKEFNICLVGSGGVGTIAAVVLEKSGRAKVTVVLRSTYEVINEKGFDIESVDHGEMKGWKPSRVVPSISEAAFAPRDPNSTPLPTGASTPQESPKERYDFLVICTKQLPEHYSLAQMVAPLITPHITTIVLIQNGLNIHLPFTTSFPTNVTLSAVSMIGSFTAGANQVKQIGPDILQIGPHYHSGVPNERSLERCETFVSMYTSGGPKSCTLTPDMPKARYAKLLWNGTYNTLCALMDMNVGEIQRSDAKKMLVEPIMREIQAVAKADGVELEDDLITHMLDRSPGTSRYRPSMLLDREQGRPMEFEVILGDPIRRGKELGVDTKVMETVYALLRVLRWKGENPDEGGEMHIGGGTDP